MLADSVPTRVDPRAGTSHAIHRACVPWVWLVFDIPGLFAPPKCILWELARLVPHCRPPLSASLDIFIFESLLVVLSITDAPRYLTGK